MKEALKLALEALEDFGNHRHDCPQWPTYAEPEKYPACDCGYEKAIKACEEALKQERKRPQNCGTGYCSCIECVMEQEQGNTKRPVESDYLSYTAYTRALEAYCDEQEQGEPVAWRNAAIRVGEDLCSVGPFGYYDMTAEQWLDWALSVVTVHLPPQQRKPLTLGQKQRLWSSVGNKLTLKDRVNSYGLAIEAAHGIKENK